jgi:hypothetical protein
MPNLLYAVRCAPCYNTADLSQYGTVIKQTLQIILNIDMTESVWSQAILPVSGGLGVRLATDLVLPAFLRNSRKGCQLHRPRQACPTYSGCYISLR